MNSVLYRKDRIKRPITKLPVRPLGLLDAWCDDPHHEDYNSAITIPHISSHEILWRSDAIYDIIVILRYNFDPAIPFKGSAIFMHIATPGYTATEGCVGVAQIDLLEILEKCSENTLIALGDNV